MKTTFFTLAILCTMAAYGQTSQEHLQNGIEKHKKQDYTGAIKDYDKSIQEDKANKDAYYNRGTCELALKDLEAAMTDFSKAIELDSGYVKAYYSRATVLVSQKKYSEALPDLDKVIGLNPATPNAFSLRGQIRAQTGDKKGGCEDLHRAKQNGDKQADKYLTQYCGSEKQVVESFELDWPVNENWKVGDDQANEQQRVLDFIHSNETIDKWTELVNMTTIKGVTGITMDTAMNFVFNQAKLNSPEAKLTLIEKDQSAEYPWILFTVEAPGFVNDTTPESQLWYLIQGKQALHTNFIAVKKANVPANLKIKWTKIFKTGQIVNK